MHKFSRLAATAVAVAAFVATTAAQEHGAGKGPSTPTVGARAPKSGGQSTHGASGAKTKSNANGSTTKTSGSPHGNSHSTSKKSTTTTESTSTSTPGGSSASATTAGTGTTATPAATLEPNKVSTRISKNPNQLARVNGMLPPGMTIDEASAGFRNQGQFIAALNASKNQHIDFVQLKQAMTVDGLSLGQAAKQLRPAPAQAGETTGTGTTSGSTSGSGTSSVPTVQ